MCLCVCSAMSNSMQPHGLLAARLLCQWNSPGKNTGVGCLFLLQGIFLAQGSHLSLLHCSGFLTVCTREALIRIWVVGATESLGSAKYL